MQKDARKCPCCIGGFASHARPIIDRYGWSWSLHTCHKCGVEYQARPMTPEARKDFYTSGRYRKLCADVLQKPWDSPEYLRMKQMEYAHRWSENINLALNDLGAPGRWLDFGGSTGVVSDEWAFDDAAVVVADWGDGAPVTPDGALDEPNASYNTILCCQTLDHLAEPLATLQQFRRLAKLNARLFVDVVKAAHTDYKLDHDTYYQSASIFLALVERAGWKTIWLDAETNPTHYSVLAEAVV